MNDAKRIYDSIPDKPGYVHSVNYRDHVILSAIYHNTHKVTLGDKDHYSFSLAGAMAIVDLYIEGP